MHSRCMWGAGGGDTQCYIILDRVPIYSTVPSDSSLTVVPSAITYYFAKVVPVNLAVTREASEEQDLILTKFCANFGEIRPPQNEIKQENLPACGAQFWSRATGCWRKKRGREGGKSVNPYIR